MTDKHGNFEIRGVDQKIIDAFSERREQVLQTVEKLRSELHTDNEHKIRDAAALESRQKKEYLSKEQLEKLWDQKLNGLGLSRDDIKQSVENAKSNVNQLLVLLMKSKGVHCATTQDREAQKK